MENSGHALSIALIIHNLGLVLVHTLIISDLTKLAWNLTNPMMDVHYGYPECMHKKCIKRKSKPWICLVRRDNLMHGHDTHNCM